MRGILSIFLLIIGITLLSHHFLISQEDFHFNKGMASLKKMDRRSSLDADQVLENWPKHSLGSFIGKDVEELVTVLGEAGRRDLSPYGYTWFIFNKGPHQYVQAGILNNKVVSLYIAGKEINIAPFKIGQSIDSIIMMNELKNKIEWKRGYHFYQIQLSEEDLNTKPLVKLGNTFVQAYIDQFTKTLSSVRFLDEETLIKHQSYVMMYRGQLFNGEEPDENEWNKIDQGMQQQIFELTNVMRAKYNLGELEWSEALADAASSHSMDMMESDYFSHFSKKYGSLEDRLKMQGIQYQLAGENIAAKYLDAPDVVEGWMNSKGHREAMLHSEFTQLGVGVYRKFYTQNFVGR